MKRSKNFTWLILGIITILVGILVPIFAFNQSVYYEVDKDTHAGNVTFYVTITSKEEIKDIQNAIVKISYDNVDDKEYEVYYIKSGKSDDDYVYEFKLVETNDWVFVDEIESVKLRTLNGVVKIEEKAGWGTRIPIIVFACVIGGFMIFVNFFNNNSKNRTIELKEIIASSTYNDYLPEENEEDIESVENVESKTKEESKEDLAEPPVVNETKTCDYCGTLSDINDKVCSSCGAKFKKK